jgi:hypothetical protein
MYVCMFRLKLPPPLHDKLNFLLLDTCINNRTITINCQFWGTLQHSTVQHSTAHHSTTQYSTAQHSTSQHNTAQYSTAQYSTVQYSTAQHSTAQYSTAQHSTAQHSTVQHSTAQHSTVQHSTAQYSTAQHSTVQHNFYSMCTFYNLLIQTSLLKLSLTWVRQIFSRYVSILKSEPSPLRYDSAVHSVQNTEHSAQCIEHRQSNDKVFLCLKTTLNITQNSTGKLTCSSFNELISMSDLTVSIGWDKRHVNKV